jgi:hypothetical protein
MTIKQHIALRVGLASLIGILFVALPFSHSVRMKGMAVVMSVFGVFLLGMCAYDLLRPNVKRPAIPWTWLSFAAGFGCFSVMLWIMAQTWNTRLLPLPTTQIFYLLVFGGIFLTVGTIGFARACDQRQEMWVADSNRRNQNG